MAISATALAADLSATGLTMSVASGSAFPSTGSTIASPPYVVQIDNEKMLAIQQPATGVIKLIQRGYDGTAAVSHDILAKVLVSANPSDFSNPSAGNLVAIPAYTPIQQTLGEDYVFTAAEVAAWGKQPRNFAILKGSACLITLVAPSTAQDGETIVFTSDTAFAHVITATTLLADAVSGSPHTTATFAAFKGASLTLQAQAGLWNVIAAVGVPIT